MSRASRMGTPEAIRVPSVRAVRATMLFSRIFPKSGILRAILSQMKAPVLFFLTILMNNQMPNGTVGIRYQYLAIWSLAQMSHSVIAGSLQSKPSKIDLNLGMIQIMMKLTMAVATKMTAQG